MKRLPGWTALFLIVAAMYVHNDRLYPVLRGYDAYGHWRYLSQTAAHDGWPPTAQEGWEDYTMPLYYVVSGAISSALHANVVDTGRTLNLVLVLAIGLLTAWTARREGLRPPWMAALLIAVNPVVVRLVAMAHNGTLTICALAAFYALLVGTWRQAGLSIRREVALGVLAGLALLSRPEGSVVLPLLACLAIARGARQPRQWGFALACLLLSLTVAGAVCAPQPLRNLARFGRMAVRNSDSDVYPMSVANSENVFPGAHSLLFFLWPGRPDADDSTEALWVPAFADAWWDSLGFFYSAARPRLVVPLACVGLAFTALAALGFKVAAEDVPQNWPCLAGVLGGIGFYCVANLALPLFMTVKAYYLLAGLSPAMVLVMLGKQRLQERLDRRARWVDLGLVGMGLFLIYACWL